MKTQENRYVKRHANSLSIGLLTDNFHSSQG